MFRNFNQISKNLKSKFFFDYNISSSTWFRTGGRADLFCIIVDEHELEIILNELTNEIPIFKFKPKMMMHFTDQSQFFLKNDDNE